MSKISIRRTVYFAVLLISLMVGFRASAQPGNLPPCLLQGAQAAVSFYNGDYTISFYGSCVSGGDTYFGYEVCKIGHTPGVGFSHVVFGRAVCASNLSLGTPTCLTGAPDCVLDSGADPTTGVVGIKWNETTALDSIGQCKSYYFSYPGSVGVTNVPAAIKAGNCNGSPEGCDVNQISGPACLIVATPSPTATTTATATATNTIVPPTVTPTVTPTNTEVPATATYTATPTATPIDPTATATATATNTIVPPTVTPTVTPTNTEVPATATYTATPTVTPVDPTATATVTATVTAVATSTIVQPTVTPIPTEISSQAACNAGGPYQLECVGNRVAAKLNGSGGGDGSTFSWTSDCPNAVISDPASLSPSLSFDSFGSNKVPSACNATLQITSQVLIPIAANRFYGEEEFVFFEEEEFVPEFETRTVVATCSSPISVGACSFDCAGAFQGGAKVDRCGVCNGNGQSCINCKSVNIQSAQLALDSNAADFRSLVLQAAHFISRGKGVTRAQKSFSKVMKNKAQSLYTQAWVNTYAAIPGAVLDCGTSAFCVKISTSSFKQSLILPAAEMSALIEQALKLVPRKQRVRAARLRKLLSKSRKLSAEQKAALNRIPDSTSSCS
jgi:hypothetical protein